MFSVVARFWVLLVLVATCGASHADKIDDFVQAELSRQNVPGASLAVVRRGKIVKEAGYGFANLEHRVPARPETVYQSGSVGKQFTAALVLLLASDGKFALDDPIGKHLPGTPESWKGVTIRHLLNHTSGLGDPYEKLDFRKDYTEAELLAIDGALPLRFEPGDSWAYSNMGYHVLGFLCSKVGGSFYADQLTSRIFKPLGMETARLISESEIVPNRAAGYELRQGKLQNQTWVSPTLNTTADGSLYLTVRDLARWDAALYTETPLSRAQKESMWTPARLNRGKTAPYGFGWALGKRNGRKLIQHSGAWQGFTTLISRYVDDELTVIVLTNRAGAEVDKIADGVAALYVPELAVFDPKRNPGPKENARFLRAFEAALKRTADPDLFEEGYRPGGFDKLPAIVAGMGARQAFQWVSSALDGADRVYVYRASYEKGTIDLRFTVGENALIMGLSVEARGK